MSINWYAVEIEHYRDAHKAPSPKVMAILVDSLRDILDTWGPRPNWALITAISDYAVISLPAMSWQTAELVKTWLDNK